MRYLFFLFIFFVTESQSWGESLKVGAVLGTPFVIKYDTAHSGVAVELWDSIARGLNKSYTLVEYSEDQTKEAFEDLSTGKIDLLIGPLSVTQASLEQADFTLPFYVDKVVPIVTHDCFRNLCRLFEMMFVSFGWILGVFIILYALYLYFLWYYERDHMITLPEGYREGISHLFWKHLLIGRHTDEPPKSIQGKGLIVSKIILSYLLLTVLSGTLISFLTVALSEWADPIQSISDLEKRHVGAITDSRSFKIGKNLGIKMFPFGSVQEGIKALKSGQIGAFLSDLSLADAYLKDVGRKGVDISHFVLRQDLHAFATRPGSPLLRKINEEMVNLRKKGVPTKICKGYLEKGVKDCDL